MKFFRYWVLTALTAVAVLGLVVYWTESSPTKRAQGEGSFAGVSLRLDYETTELARERGLGGRTHVPENYGMLFVFPRDGLYGFWMKDMLVPLDMFWFDDKGQVVSFYEGVATSTYPKVFYPSVPARYVLETAAGFGEAHGVATGTPLVLAGGLQSLESVTQ